MPGPFAKYFLTALLASPFPTLPAEPRAPHCDLYGDPLPPGAVARLGTTRFRHVQKVTGMAFLPDGRGLLVADYWGNLVVWNVKTGKRLRDVPWQGRVTTALALSADGATAAVVEGGCLTLLDVVAGRRICRLDTPGLVWDAALSPDGKFVAGATDSEVVFWDRTTGRVLRRIEAPLEKFPRLTVSAGGRVLASSSRGVFEWDAATGLLVLCLRGPDDGSWRRPVAFTPDGKQFVVADTALRGIALRDTLTGRELWHANVPAGVVGVAASPDGKTLAASDNTGGIALWDMATGKQLRRTARTEGESPDDLVFSPDGRLLAVGTGRAVRLWETATDREVGTPAAHSEGISAVACSPDGKTLATGSSDGTIRVWDRTSDRQVCCLRTHSPEVFTVAFSPDGQSLAFGGRDSPVRVWDMGTRTERRPLFDLARGVFASLAFAPGGRSLAVGEGGTVIVCEPRTGRELLRLPAELLVSSLAWSPDGKVLAAGDSLGSLHWWQMPSGKELPSLRPGKACEGVAFSPDGRALASSHSDGAVCLWDTATGRELRRFPGRGALAFSADGRLLAVAGHEGRVCVVEVVSGAERWHREAHGGWVAAVAFAPDGGTLVTGGGDMTALVWDLYAAPVAPKGAVTDSLWAALAGQDARAAHDALTALIASPREGVALLKRQVPPTPVADPKRLARLIAELDHDDFATRERAMAELEAHDQQVVAALRKVLADRPGAEVERRAEDLLARLNSGAASPARLPQGRALEALEHMHIPEAHDLLRRLAEGAPDAWLTREAKAALRRVTR